MAWDPWPPCKYLASKNLPIMILESSALGRLRIRGAWQITDTFTYWWIWNRTSFLVTNERHIDKNNNTHANHYGNATNHSINRRKHHLRTTCNDHRSWSLKFPNLSSGFLKKAHNLSSPLDYPNHDLNTSCKRMSLPLPTTCSGTTQWNPTEKQQPRHPTHCAHFETHAPNRHDITKTLNELSNTYERTYEYASIYITLTKHKETQPAQKETQSLPWNQKKTPQSRKATKEARWWWWENPNSANSASITLTTPPPTNNSRTTWQMQSESTSTRTLTDRHFPKALTRNLQTPSTAETQHLMPYQRRTKKSTQNATHRLGMWRNFWSAWLVSPANPQTSSEACRGPHQQQQRSSPTIQQQ